jgi:hypothetical protein
MCRGHKEEKAIYLPDLQRFLRTRSIHDVKNPVSYKAETGFFGFSGGERGG